jgi:phosphoribosylaminoimidazolecarboxamide formyltransferase/IMP cyclohydrolase
VHTARRALASCHDKEGLEELASGLAALGWEIHASGGTAAFLESRGVQCVPTERLTGISSLLGGRVKTLHPSLHAAILAAGADREGMAGRGEIVFDMVAVDLYPFPGDPGAWTDAAACVELIDVGGPAMIRAAAKNHRHVIAAPGRQWFPEVLERVRAGSDDDGFRREMASRTFAALSEYDLRIALALGRSGAGSGGLRYGENPHQKAWTVFRSPASGLGAAELLHGDSLSYNNMLDASAAWDLVNDLPHPSTVIVKHGNPCCAAAGETPADALERALEADRTSPYGGILAVNATVGEDLVELVRGLFLELLLAPDYTAGALERLGRRRKLRVLRVPPGRETALQTRSISGGILVQEADPSASGEVESARLVTRRPPTGDETLAMDFGWRICRAVRSNAMVLAGPGRALGVGAGQMSRIESLDLAVRRALAAGLPLAGSALASDGLIPFADSVEAAAAAGVTAIVQPGGSLRDDEVAAAADAAGMTMLLTGRRHFRH